MLSIDTHLLLYSLNQDCAEFERAQRFVDSIKNAEVVLCELVLVELYLLLRNPAVVGTPCSASKAAGLCQRYRQNASWRLVEAAPVMSEVWRLAAAETFPRRLIIDARLALTLRHHGVTEFATRNRRDFEHFGFARVWDPLHD